MNEVFPFNIHYQASLVVIKFLLNFVISIYESIWFLVFCIFLDSISGVREAIHWFWFFSSFSSWRDIFLSLSLFTGLFEVTFITASSAFSDFAYTRFSSWKKHSSHLWLFSDRAWFIRFNVFLLFLSRHLFNLVTSFWNSRAFSSICLFKFLDVRVILADSAISCWFIFRLNSVISIFRSLACLSLFSLISRSNASRVFDGLVEVGGIGGLLGVVGKGSPLARLFPSLWTKARGWLFFFWKTIGWFATNQSGLYG